jgi:hypothetical protein
METTSFQYRAFLIYSHRDKAWGERLHAALEGYAVDKALNGRETPVGPIPKFLRPNFRAPRNPINFDSIPRLGLSNVGRANITKIDAVKSIEALFDIGRASGQAVKSWRLGLFV